MESRAALGWTLGELGGEGPKVRALWLSLSPWRRAESRVVEGAKVRGLWFPLSLLWSYVGSRVVEGPKGQGLMAHPLPCRC